MPRMLSKLKPERAWGLKRCVDCGAYAERHYTTCPRCKGAEFEHPWNDDPAYTEDCPTCDQKKRPEDAACPMCAWIHDAAPPPQTLGKKLGKLVPVTKDGRTVYRYEQGGTA